MYEQFINQLLMYNKVIILLSKGYLPISLLPPSQLQEISAKSKGYSDNKPELQYSHKKATFIL